MRRAGKRRLAIPLLITVLFLSACDSSEDDKLADIEILSGKWAITGLADDTGDRSEIVAQGFEGIHLEFGDNGVGVLELFHRHGPARVLPINYTVDEDVDFVKIMVGMPIGAVLTLELTYAFTPDGRRARFHAPHPDAVNTIFESDLSGEVDVLASKIDGDDAPAGKGVVLISAVRSSYAVGDTIEAKVSNFTDKSLFFENCCGPLILRLERWEDGKWISLPGTCFTLCLSVPAEVLAGETRTVRDTYLPSLDVGGTYRLSSSYWLKPKADAAALQAVSPVFAVE